LLDPPPEAPPGAPDLRGANQSLVFSLAGAPPAAAAASAEVSVAVAAATGALTSRCACAGAPAEPADSAGDSASPTGVRTTTGGMGRDPGMLIRIRVVSVVSVLRSSGGVPVAERPASAPFSEAVGVP
jgi:hypothetical protein